MAVASGMEGKTAPAAVSAASNADSWPVVVPNSARRGVVVLQHVRPLTLAAVHRVGVAGGVVAGISESTAHAYTSAVVDLLAERAPGLLKTDGRTGEE
ncbi:hypothetical protein FHX80_12586 [Streptomyces brevispora]|uniref:Uncharacterized protein n=1 Tax=Streptomyces brevispora TaxID=887462 RepID=A0A561TYR9_9ACTN|nr:hypothetical protein FHX80_12586 [Streptomyces brevispora]